MAYGRLLPRYSQLPSGIDPSRPSRHELENRTKPRFSPVECCAVKRAVVVDQSRFGFPPSPLPVKLCSTVSTRVAGSTLKTTPQPLPLQFPRPESFRFHKDRRHGKERREWKSSIGAPLKHKGSFQLRGGIEPEDCSVMNVALVICGVIGGSVEGAVAEDHPGQGFNPSSPPFSSKLYRIVSAPTSHSREHRSVVGELARSG